MKIFIDDGLASSVKISGIGQHTLHLWKHLKDIVECDMSNYRYLTIVPRIVRRFAYFVIANMMCLSTKYNVVHYQNNYVPFVRRKSKKVVTIYDLGVFRYPETISPFWRHYNQFAFNRAIERSDAIVAISKTVRDELSEKFSALGNDRISVIPCGIRDSFMDSKPQVEDIIPLSLQPYKYFLHVGDLMKRKNLVFLLDAFIKAKELKKIDESTQLILVGKRGWGYHELKHLLREDLGVRVLGYLPDQTLVSLYRFCKAFVFPSYYEGFGIPIVEAMSQRAPIIASDIPTNIELDNQHNKQMFIFQLGDHTMLIHHLVKVDKEWELLRSCVQYGDLSRYNYAQIAQEHLKLYQNL